MVRLVDLQFYREENREWTTIRVLLPSFTDLLKY